LLCTTKARKGEHDYALNDACEMVDDTLSCSMLEFMGNGTKKFFNKGKKEDPGTVKCAPFRSGWTSKTRKRAFRLSTLSETFVR
jgi:hypothetical protein